MSLVEDAATTEAGASAVARLEANSAFHRGAP
jgi:hypothetical protein